MIRSLALRGILTGADRKSRLARRWSNTLLRRLGPYFSGEVINVSAWRDEDKEGHRYRDYFPHASAYYTSNLGEGYRGADDARDITDFVLDLVRPLPPDLERRFDVVFNHTTLEHIFDVGVAFGHLCQMSRDIVITVVPFAQEMHGHQWYGDFWRFSPLALRRLFAVNGLEVVYEAASPFSNAAIYVLSVGSRHPTRWIGTLPTWKPVETLGNWIGRPQIWQVLLARLWRTVPSPDGKQ